MLDYALIAEELAELRKAHLATRDKRDADRVNWTTGYKPVA